MNKKIISLCSVATMTLVFSACGGGGATTSSYETDTTGKSENIEIVGRVIDGYVKNATVFFDINRDGKLQEKEEPSYKTDEYGRFSLILSKDQSKYIDRRHFIIAKADGVDIDTQKDFKTSLSVVPTSTMIKNPIYITPLSTFAGKAAYHAVFSGTMAVQKAPEALNKTFGIDFSKQPNFVKDNNLEAYKINNILQKAVEISGQSYDELAKKFGKSWNKYYNKETKTFSQDVSLDEFLSKVQNKDSISNMKDFYSSITENEMKEKRISIAKKVDEKVKKKESNFTSIAISDLQKDEEFTDVEEFKPDGELDNVIEKKGFLYSHYNNEATIFLDENKNLILDKGEISTKTGKNGGFSIKVPRESIEKRRSLVAIDGKNSKSDTTNDILFATTMLEGDIHINTFTSFMTAFAYAITNQKTQQSDISHSNMVPSLGATLGLTIGDKGSINQVEADTTKDEMLNKKALKLDAYVKAIANTYNNDDSYQKKILEAYIHLIANAISNNPRVNDKNEKIDETGLVHLMERFNTKNTLVNKDGKTFAQLLEEITDGVDNNISTKEMEKLIEEAKDFRPEKKKEAKDWEVSFNGEVLLPKDQFSKYQWHIKDQGAIVNTHGIFSIGNGDLGVMELYKKGYVGKNAYVRVVDDGVEAGHEDLKARVDINNSYNAQTKENDPTSPQIEDSHGTNVAGLIAADGSNNIGLKGVAPYATLSAYKLRTPQAGSLDYDYDELTEAWLGGNDEISIVNNSWGSTIDKYIEEEKLLKQGATTKRVRNGKALGRIYLIAAGNGGFNQRDNEDDDILDIVDDSNTSYFRGSQYAITVGAVRNENIVTQYSAQGSNVLVSGYGGGIKTHTSALMATTTRTGATRETWDEDSKKAYSFTFDGTSAATPVTSGALALVLSECPDLSYRDVKWLIAHTAKKIDENYDGKTISGVKNVPSFKTAPKKDLDQGFGYVVNGAGLSHSNYYGYGLINPAAMIEKCKDPNFEPLPEKRTVKVVNENMSLTNLKDSENHLLTEKITINASDLQGNKNINKIEWVGLTVYGKVDNLQKISMVLISPSGTISRILTNSKTAFDDVAVLEEGYRFSSVAFVDEDPKGEWTLLVQSTDDKKIDTGKLMKLELEVVGYKK